MSLTAGRFHAPVSPLFREAVLQPMLDAELAAFSEYIAVDRAHTVMLIEQGIINRDAGGKILNGLRSIETLGRDQFPLEADDTLLLQFESYLEGAIGVEAAGAMHTGRSRNDQMAAAYRLQARAELLTVLDALSNLQDVALELATSSQQVLLPGYTHLQRAQPITFAHYLLRHIGLFERDQLRIEGAFARTNLNPLGGAAMAGTSWPIDRHRTAELLGFSGIVGNSIDAGIFNTDYPPEIAGACAIVVTNAGRLAADLYIWSTTEFGIVEVGDELAGTSSIMPQKKNPESLERIIALAGLAAGWQGSVLGVHRGVSSSDLGPAFAGTDLPDCANRTSSSLQLLAATLDTMHVNADKARMLLNDDWSAASALADKLVAVAGLPFRQAHQVVARVVRNAINAGLVASDVDAAFVTRASEEILGHALPVRDPDIRRVMDPDTFIESRTSLGGTNSARVTEALVVARELQKTHSDWLDATRSRLHEAEAELRRVAEQMTA